jgi:hypothetical protein
MKRTMDMDFRPVFRAELAKILTDRGFKISSSALANLHIRGAGPPIEGYWGRRPIFDPDRGIEWAKSLVRPA